jgi:hypothetical protein
MSIDKVRGRALKRTLSGPSKTITVESSKVPRAPPVPKVAPRARTRRNRFAARAVRSW